MSILCQNLTFNYSKRKSNSRLFDNFGFELNNNEKKCIYGETGSGKTSLFNLFFGEIKPDKGKILLDNIPLHKEKKLSDKVAFLFQNPEKQFVFPLIHDEYNFLTHQNNEIAIKQNIKELCGIFNVKIELFFHKDIYELSYGELRLLQIIFSFSVKTEYLILDEPADHLEKILREKLFDLIKSTNNKGILILTKYPELYETVVDESIPINARYA
ncbi:MAG: ATP-binding cassette domain-containing protein [Candidatus Celaenobacter antarcticus]|nr:ATP-binding cassette domain-containing protein [Candidatus Celaenobacter antarcticus]MDP8315611.1 ATP-binding cassette domain-containing protein [Candidatus Celaenobacter antarcticus]